MEDAPGCGQHCVLELLAWWTGEAGDPAAAWDHYAELLPLRERVLGPEHPATLADPARARPLDRQGGRWP